MSARLDVRLPGPLEVRRSSELVRIAAPKQRALLALMALDAGRVVSSDELADRLWAGETPASAVTALQVYISQLRIATLKDIPGDWHLYRSIAGTEPPQPPDGP